MRIPGGVLRGPVGIVPVQVAALAPTLLTCVVCRLGASAGALTFGALL
ncbi:hypothetical protein [Arthrobacter sp. Br18]|nr:hypothetical protein [Arthrobacter sp. Br18]